MIQFCQLSFHRVMKDREHIARNRRLGMTDRVSSRRVIPASYEIGISDLALSLSLSLWRDTLMLTMLGRSHYMMELCLLPAHVSKALRPLSRFVIRRSSGCETTAMIQRDFSILERSGAQSGRIDRST